MKNILIIVTIIIILISNIFTLKSHTKNQLYQLKNLQKEIIEKQKIINILEIELQYQTRLKRLRDLSILFPNLRQTTAEQMIYYSDENK